MLSRRNFSLVLTAVSVLALAAGPVGALGPTPPSWKPREEITDDAEPNEHHGADRILAYDHHGKPGVAYIDGDGETVKFARRLPVLGWQTTTIVDSYLYARHPSLAFDRYERPAVSAYTNVGGLEKGVTCTRFDGAAWSRGVLDTGATKYSYTSIAFDLYGRAAIAYEETAGPASRLTYCMDTDNDGDWADETPETVSWSEPGRYATLAFDPANVPIIAHEGAAPDEICLSVGNPEVGWATQTVLTAARRPSLAINPVTGYPAIACTDNDLKTLIYTEYNGAAWNTVYSGSPYANQFGDVSLAFDPADGHPAIAYYEDESGGSPLDDEGGMLRLAWFDGDSWQTQTVDYVGDVGQRPSIAFNEYGTGWPGIAYFDSTDALYYIEDPPMGLPEPATLALVAAGAAGLALRPGKKDRRAA